MILRIASRYSCFKPLPLFATVWQDLRWKYSYITDALAMEATLLFISLFWPNLGCSQNNRDEQGWARCLRVKSAQQSWSFETFVKTKMLEKVQFFVECWKWKWVFKQFLEIPRPLPPGIHRPINFTKKKISGNC